MYKSKLVKFGAIALVLGCVAVGCGDKKEDNQTKNANATDVTTEADKSANNAKETTGKTEPGDDFQQIIDDAIAGDWDCSPYGVMSKLEDAGYDYDFVKKYVEDMDVDWVPCAKKLGEEAITRYQSEYYVRTTLENSDGFSRDDIDKALEELNIDFANVCYDYMYWKCSGQYPADDSAVEELKESCSNSKFTDSQIETAIAKLAENCK